MKKMTIVAMAFATMMAASCGMGTMGTTGTEKTSSASTSANGGLGDVLGSVLSGGGVNAIQSVLGLDKMTKASLVDTWKYSGPGCAFTSEQLLAKAGGEVIASEIKDKLLPTYKSLGLSSSNTYLKLNQDGTFSAKIKGTPISGNYTFNESNSQLQLQGLLLNITCYTKRTGSNVSFLFESKKLLSLLQTVSALSGNTTLQTIGDLSKNYDGVRIGFDMSK